MGIEQRRRHVGLLSQSIVLFVGLAGMLSGAVSLATWSTPPASAVEDPAHIVLDSVHAFLAAEGLPGFASFDSGLLAWDVSDPRSLFEVGRITRFKPEPVDYDSPGYEDIAADGEWAVLASGSDGIEIIDVSTPASPRRVTRLELPLEDGRFGLYADRVRIDGDYAYVGWACCNPVFPDMTPSGGVDVIALGASPRVVARWTPADFAWGSVRGLDVEAGRMYVLFAGCGGFAGLCDSSMYAVSVSSPTSPRELGSVDLGSFALGGPGPNDLVFDDPHAFIADGDVSLVAVFDPSEPFDSFGVSTPGEAQAIDFSGGYVYAADGIGGLFSYYMHGDTKPGAPDGIHEGGRDRAPAAARSVASPGAIVAVDVATTDTHAFVITVDGRIVVYDITRHAPSIVSETEIYGGPDLRAIDVVASGGADFSCLSGDLTFETIPALPREGEPFTLRIRGTSGWSCVPSASDVTITSGGGTVALTVRPPLCDLACSPVLTDFTLDLDFEGWFEGEYIIEWREGCDPTPPLCEVGVVEILPCENAAEIVLVSAPDAVRTGESFEAEVDVLNTGSCTWSDGRPDALAIPVTARAALPYHLAHIGGETFGLETEQWLATDVEPGEVAAFELSMTAPDRSGTHASLWRMNDGVEAFGPTARFDIRVEAPPDPPTPDPGPGPTPKPGKPKAVFVHGYGGGINGMGTSTHRCSEGLLRYPEDDTDFGDLAETFQEHGYDTYLARWTTNRDETIKIEDAAECLASQIEGLLAGAPSEQVTLVGHSMGGLVSRYYIEALGRSSRVKRLITFGSPHAGIPDAFVAGWLSTDLTKPWNPCDAHPGACQLRETSVTKYNKKYSPHPDVDYDIVGGTRGSLITSGMLSGEDDAVVQTASATSLTGAKVRRWEVHDAHLLAFSPIARDHYKESDESSSCLLKIIGDGGSEIEDCDPSVLTRVEDAVVPGGVGGGERTQAATTSVAPVGPQPQRLPVVTGALAAGERVDVGLDIDGFEATIAVTWRGGEVELALITPDGVRIDRDSLATHAPGGEYEHAPGDGSGFSVYKLPIRDHGEWRAEVRAVGGPSEFSVMTTMLADVELTLESPAPVGPGDTVSVRAWLDELGDEVEGAVLRAAIAVGAEIGTDAILRKVEPGGTEYRADVRVPSGAEEDATLRVSATGTTRRGIAFSREHLIIVPVLAPGVRLDGDARIGVRDRDSEGRIDTLRLEVPIRSSLTGRGFAMVTIRGIDGRSLSLLDRDVDLPLGEELLTFDLDGRPIGEAGLDGPYEVDLEILDETGFGTVLYASPLLTTPAWRSSDFVGGRVRPSGRLFLPVVLHGLACPSPTPPIDLALVLDVSPAMHEPGAEGRTPLQGTVDALHALVDRLSLADGKDRVAVLHYGLRADEVLPLTSDRPTIDAAIDLAARQEAPGTQLAAAFYDVAAALPAEAGRSRVALFAFHGGDTPRFGDALLGAAGVLRGAGVAVVIVGVGSSSDAPILEAAARSRRAYIEVRRADELVGRLELLDAAVRCPGGAGWP